MEGMLKSRGDISGIQKTYLKNELKLIYHYIYSFYPISLVALYKHNRDALIKVEGLKSRPGGGGGGA